MFSSRLHPDFIANPITAAVGEHRAAGRTLFDLTESNPTRADLPYDEGAIGAALNDPQMFLYDPKPAGMLAAREAVTEYYAEAGVSVIPEQVLLTASTSEAYALLFKLLADPGDEVLVPRPSYPLFEFLAALEAVRVVSYPLRYHDGWFIDREILEQSLTPRTRAVVLVNPNNPTGSYLKQGEHAWLTSLCAARGIAIISDEVFADYALMADPQRVTTLAGETEALTFSLSGLSKVAGLPQMKLGWIVTSGPPQLQHEAHERLEFIADTYLSVSTPVQLAAPALLATRTMFQARLQERLRSNLAWLQQALATSSLRPLLVEGGWYAVLQVPRIRTEEEWVLTLLREHSVLVQPGFFYDFEQEAFLVLSLLTSELVFQEGVSRLQNAA